MKAIKSAAPVRPSPSMKGRWYLSRKGRPSGPYSDAEIATRAVDDAIDAADLLWRPGFLAWTRADEVPGLLTPPPLPDEFDLKPAVPAGGSSLRLVATNDPAPWLEPVEQPVVAAPLPVSPALPEPEAATRHTIVDDSPIELVTPRDAVAALAGPATAVGDDAIIDTALRAEVPTPAPAPAAVALPAADAPVEAATDSAAVSTPAAPPSEPAGESGVKAAEVAHELAGPNFEKLRALLDVPAEPAHAPATNSRPNYGTLRAQLNASRQARPPSGSYVVRHWRGEFSPGRSIVLNGFVLTGAAVAVCAYIALFGSDAMTTMSDWLQAFGFSLPRIEVVQTFPSWAEPFGAVAPWAVAAGITAFSLIGMVRSLRRRSS